MSLLSDEPLPGDTVLHLLLPQQRAAGQRSLLLPLLPPSSGPFCFLSPLLSEKGPELPFPPFFSLSTFGRFCLFMSPTLKTDLLAFILIFLYEDLTCLFTHRQLPRRLDRFRSASGSSECLLSRPGALEHEAAQDAVSLHSWQVPSEPVILSLYSQKKIKDSTIVFHTELHNTQCRLSRKQL